MTAGQDALADAVQESTEHHTVVVVHIVHDGEVKADVIGVRSGAQVVAQSGQLGDGDGGRLVRLANGGQALQHLVHRAVHADKVTEQLGILRADLVFLAYATQVVRILLAHATGDLTAQRFIGAQIVQNGGQNAEVGNVEHVAFTDAGKGGGGKSDDLVEIVGVDVADALEAGLHDLLEVVGAGGHAVDVLTVAHLLLATRAILGVLDDGEGHIGLEGEELATHIVEGDDAVADKKILVLHVEIVLLEFAHLEGQVSVLPIEGAQGEYRAVLGSEIGCFDHGYTPFREISVLV